MLWWVLPLEVPMRLVLALFVLALPTAALADNALRLDGDMDRVDLGTLDPGTSFTVEGWVKFDSLDGWDTLWEVTDTATSLDSFYTGYIQGYWQVEVEDQTVWEGDTCEDYYTLCWADSPAAGDSYHVAVVVTGGMSLLYVDGTLVQSLLHGETPGFGTDVWVLGADTDYPGTWTSDPLDGWMDEVRVWSTARSQAEIQCTMDYAITGTEASLYAYYPMDDAPGSGTATDATGLGWDGLMVGDATFEPSPFGLLPSTGGDIPCFDYDGDGYSPDDGDCDDTALAVNPGATEVWYDGLDSDCDGASDFDQDGDGYDATAWGGTDCDDGARAIHPGATDRWYDGIDSDCDGASDYDQDGDGYDATAYGGTDCDDLHASVHPGAPDIWYDGVDSDCDGASDYDQDGDGYTSSSYGGSDCDDTDAAVHRGATETWYDGVDQDCSGGSDYDQDGDGHLSDAYTGDDCDDLDAGVNPAQTDDASDNLVDNDCDGWKDEEALDDSSLIFSEVSRISTAGSSPTAKSFYANWFEVHNTESFAIALDNVAFRACDEAASCGGSGGWGGTGPAWTGCDATNWFAVSPDAGLVIPAGGYATFCHDSSVWGTPADCDYEWSDTSWAGTNPDGIAYYDASFPLYRDQNGMLGVWIDGAGLDEMGWYYTGCAAQWPILQRYTITLSLGARTAAGNDDPDNWCDASASNIWATVPQDNYGTPGATDASCP